MKLLIFLISVSAVCSRLTDNNDMRNNNGDLAMWIDEKQVKMVSGEYLSLRAHYPSPHF